MVVVTVPTLGGREVAAYTRDLGKACGVDRGEEDDGVILLVGPNEQSARIAVGYGLEKKLPDVLCQRIMDEQISPRFRKGDLPGGIEAGVSAIMEGFGVASATCSPRSPPSTSASSRETSRHPLQRSGVADKVLHMEPIRLIPDNNQLQQAALKRLEAADWTGLLSLIQELPPQSAYVTMQLLADAAPFSADVSPLIAAEGAWELTLAGALLHGRALRFRGLGQADTVSEDQWEMYLPTLAHAQELLAEANRKKPELGLAAAWRVTAFVDASEEEKDEAEMALRQSSGIPVSGLSRLITMRSEKWGGSHEEMWKVVADYAESDPPGSLGLIAKAHFEHWLWFAAFDEDPEGPAKAYAYFRNTEVQGDLRDASLRVIAAESSRDPRAILFADNAFAVTFWSARSVGQARPHLQRMGKHMDRTLWLFDNPRAELNRARLRAWLLPV